VRTSAPARRRHPCLACPRHAPSRNGRAFLGGRHRLGAGLPRSPFRFTQFPLPTRAPRRHLTASPRIVVIMTRGRLCDSFALSPDCESCVKLPEPPLRSHEFNLYLGEATQGYVLFQSTHEPNIRTGLRQVASVQRLRNSFVRRSIGGKSMRCGHIANILYSPPRSGSAQPFRYSVSRREVRLR
jgi:hypothetical protein